MPETEVAGEGEPGCQEQRPFTGVAPRRWSALEKIQKPKHWDGERHAPECGGRGAGLGEAYEDRREGDAGGADEQRAERGIHGPRMVRDLVTSGPCYFRSFQRLAAAS